MTPIIQNLMEEIVLQNIAELMAKEKICKCKRCQLDVAAIALNNLPPRYVVTSEGATYAKADFLEIQKYVDVIGAIAKAIKLVKESPRH